MEMAKHVTLDIVCEQVPLTRQEEIAAHKAGNYDLLIRAQMGVVVKVVREVCKLAKFNEVEDMVSVGFIALSRCVPLFDASHGSRLSSYVWRSVQTEVFREIKRLRKFEPLSCAAYEQDIPDRDQRETIDSDMRAAINSLPENLQKLIDALLEGKTYAEIGVEMGVTRQRIEQLRKAAIQQLRTAC